MHRKKVHLATTNNSHTRKLCMSSKKKFPNSIFPNLFSNPPSVIARFLKRPSNWSYWFFPCPFVFSTQYPGLFLKNKKLTLPFLHSKPSNDFPIQWEWKPNSLQCPRKAQLNHLASRYLVTSSLLPPCLSSRLTMLFCKHNDLLIAPWAHQPCSCLWIPCILSLYRELLPLTSTRFPPSLTLGPCWKDNLNKPSLKQNFSDYQIKNQIILIISATPYSPLPL